MAAPSFSPKFIRAKVAFEIDGKLHSIGEHLINPQLGVPGFSWAKFNPIETVGMHTRAAIVVPGESNLEFNCDAMFTCEETEERCLLGLNLLLDIKDTVLLNDAIRIGGIHPEYVRKFPRIQFNESVSVFPSRAIFMLDDAERSIMMACDIDNLSPIGLQIHTEDARARDIKPGDVAQIQLQPRGEFETPVSLATTVKRIIHVIDPLTQNLREYMGLSILSMEPDHKTRFTELLRKIVLQLRG